ncbi:sensor histidine kinase [Kribbella antibiotica]|uniref:histidine kinase n=1 Tax=Kribbella antibiotica TaxID=190195 RepID=A0A4R4ZJE3_9ACTN|nr:histidine kinase [Kribbella antibiotica]TDD58753.1 sensor histidine kinase [Kribbella antibiotica]
MDTPVRRNLRDWCVDAVVFLFALAFGLAVFSDTLATMDADWKVVLDLVSGLALCLTLWWRRRWPVQLALAAAVISIFSETASGSTLVLVLSVAVYRPLRTTLIVFAANSISLAAYLQVKQQEEPAALAIAAVSLYTAVAGWGLYIRSRRQLLQTLRDRADRAETVARLQAEQGQLRAREEIAREMHDVLGHRLSLLSVHAGALAYRGEDATPKEVAEASEVIRASAHQALQDLREVIGVLRAPVGELPQPTFADLPALVEASQAAGVHVELQQDINGTLPDHIGRTAYRIVQEGLTNAMKHAPGERVAISVVGAPGNGLELEVSNPAPDVRRGEGQGLKGLKERAALVDGRLEHGRTPDGDFRLSAWLPWPS